MNPNAQVRRELHQSIAGQYGSRPAAGAAVNPTPRCGASCAQSVAGQYGPAR